jgi:hypothetical protein
MKTTSRLPLAATALAVVCGFLAASPATAAGHRAAGHPRPTTPATWAARAENAYDALQKNLYQGPAEHGLYAEQTPQAATDNPHSYLWEFREATEAARDMAALPHRGQAYTADAAERFDTLQLYFNPRDGRPGYDSYLPAPLGQDGDVFYDDNAVVGLSLLDQYRATGDRTFLDRAETAYGTVSRGWDTDQSKTCPGGMDWVDTPTNTIRAANVTGLAAELAARLYQADPDSRFLTSAKTWYGWNRDCLRQAPGLYNNDRDDDGTVNTTLWTYNSGAMVGAATALYRDTGDRGYLGKAVEDADASLAYWTQGTRLHDQPAVFNAFYFADLAQLDAVRPDPRYRAAAAAYAEQTWQHNRDAATGLFRFQPSGGGDYDPAGPAQTLEQSALVQILAGLATRSS